MRAIEKMMSSSGYQRKFFSRVVPRRCAHFTTPESGKGSASVNNDEVKKFSAVGKDWWNAESNRGTGPLHSMNPVRIDFIRRTLAAQLSLHSVPPNLQLQGLDILDVGCGGGILSEGLARLGANVTSIDPSDANIAVASRHCKTDPSTSKINYMQTTVEEIAQSSRKFDVVCSLEVIEHVETPMSFVTACSSLVKTGGSLYLSTINRNLKSFGVAIVGAEYVLNMLPPGTHDWHKFITPDELTMMVETGQSGMTVLKREGIVMSINPMNGNFVWHLDPNDLGINYILHAVKS